MDPRTRHLMPRSLTCSTDTAGTASHAHWGQDTPFLVPESTLVSSPPPRHLMSPPERKAGESGEKRKPRKQNIYLAMATSELNSGWENNFWVYLKKIPGLDWICQNEKEWLVCSQEQSWIQHSKMSHLLTLKFSMVWCELALHTQESTSKVVLQECSGEGGRSGKAAGSYSHGSPHARRWL